MAIERREQVFVSSTYVDLLNERQAVIQTLLEADCIPAGMELFPASDDDKWTLIRRVIDDSDYYVVLVGGRYGTIDPATDISYTEMEFDYALDQGKPILGFLHGDPGHIELDKSELEPAAREKLSAFRAKVGERMVKFWTTPDELGGQVAKSLIQIRKTHPAEGWVRARSALTPEVEKELADLRLQVAELEAAVTQAQAVPPVATEELAQGTDVYEIDYRLRYYTKDQVKAGETYRNTPWKWFSTSATWDAMFARVAPILMDEASEVALKDVLDTFAVEIFNEEQLQPADYGRGSSLEVAQEVVQDVKVQFFSLGLIAQSERRRAVSDSNAYWKLTAQGRDHLMRLRAIRRETSSPAPKKVVTVSTANAPKKRKATKAKT